MNICHDRPNADGTIEFTYENYPITRRGELLNLTLMWIANDRPRNRRPVDWLDLPATRRFQERLRVRLFEALADSPDGMVGISHHAREPGDLVVTDRSQKQGQNISTWAHWQLGLVYAHYLSPDFYIWCNELVRNGMERFGGPPAGPVQPTGALFEELFGHLHRRLDVLGQYACDNLVLTAALLPNQRKLFSPRTKRIISAVVARDPFDGQCPCCRDTQIFSENGARIAVAEFDHFYGGGLNRPEYGWLICKRCHDDFTRGSPLLRIGRIRSFHAFQAEVLNHLVIHRSGSITG